MSADEAAALVAKSELRRRATSFAKRFAGANSEKSESQTFWNEFFAVFGIERAQVAAFEQLAKRSSTGGRGWIDLLFPSQMAVEQKSRGEDLEAAMGQILDYLPSLTPAEHPWLLVACDFGRFRWRNLNDGSYGEFALEDLPDNLDLFWWIARYPTPDQRFENIEEANLAASTLMAQVHDRLVDLGYGGHPLREWLTRLLFCMFADDTGVWPSAAFQAYVAAHTAPDGSDLGPRIAYLFQVLNTPPEDRSPALDEELAQFTYINGDIFEETLPIPTCDSGVRDAILKACRFDWTAISPAVFGAMFQNVMDAPERRQLGAHYTTEENILKTIRPLFLDDLEGDLARADSQPKLEAFLDRLVSLTFLDPACGCGNFLVVTYREIRQLETEALRQLERKRGRGGQRMIDVTLRCHVRVDQFYGIEIEEFPAKIARTAMYLMDHLANREVSSEFGEHYVRFPIPAAPHIVTANALRIDWDDVLSATDCDFVFGNPPFGGRQFRTAEQQEDHRIAHGNAKGHGVLDYVTGWFVKAAEYMKDTPARAALVATNSISQGQNVGSLWPRLLGMGLTIDFAHRPFRWTSEASGQAHVHVVIVGFSYDQATRRTIFEYPDPHGDPVEISASQISPYLTDTDPIIVETSRKMLTPRIPEAEYGSMVNDGGGLIYDEGEYLATDAATRALLRPYVGAEEMLRDRPRWVLWLNGVPPSEFRSLPDVMRRLAAVKEYRSNSKRAATRKHADTPGLLAEPRRVGERFLLVPFVSSERRSYVPMRFYEPPTIVAAPAWCIPGADEYLFGILNSEAFMAWVRTVAGRLESRFRLSPGTIYNTFPFPDPTDAQRGKIEKAAKGVLDARGAHQGSTLADLYDPLAMPANLVQAHRDLDAAVDATLSPRKRKWTEAERLAILMRRYETMTGQLPLTGESTTRRRRRATRNT